MARSSMVWFLVAAIASGCSSAPATVDVAGPPAVVPGAGGAGGADDDPGADAGEDPIVGSAAGDDGARVDDPCVERDECPDEPGDEGDDADAGAPGPADAGPPGAGGAAPAPGAPPGYVAGAKLVVRMYAPFRAAPDPSAPLRAGISPHHGGVQDESVQGPPRAGIIPPGQRVVLVDPERVGSYLRIRYDGVEGWVNRFKVALVDEGARKVDFALRKKIRDAFFKRQARDGAHNQDGPDRSSNCAPASLAIALHVLGEEPPGLSVEQSIHRVRLSYGDHTDAGGTKLSQITAAAKAFGVFCSVRKQAASPAATMAWIDAALAHHRMVQLGGLAGPSLACCEAGGHECGPPTAYQKAFIQAGYDYSFDCFHSILVLGRAGARYVVADPLSRVGVIELDAAELRDFVTRWGGTGNVVGECAP